MRGRQAEVRAGKPSILFINQYYWPDRASTAQHLTDLAEWLAAAGWTVRVLCGRGTYHPGDPKPRRRETHNGVSIERVWATSFGRRTALGRMIDYASFYLGAVLRAVLGPRPEIVVTLTTPPLLGLVGMLTRRKRGVRHVCWSMDLHPDASVALGRLNPLGRLGKRLDQIARSIDKQADRIVALGPYMADRLQKRGVRLERISIIPVWSRMDEVEPIPREENTLRKSLNLFDKTVVMYSGNMGLAHAFDEVLQAIDRLRHRSDILFMFVGGGPRRAEIERAAKEQGLPNVRFEDSFPRSELSQILTLADIHLITMRSGMGGIVVPGKLYGIMAAGRPAVFVGPEHCETADTIRGAECGLVTRLGDVAALVQAIETLADDPSLQQAMGVLGRDAMILDHERAGCCQAWAVMLEELAPLHPHRTRITPRLSSPETQLPASHAPRPRLRTIRRAQVTERHG